jgi:hypothetical protein
MSSPAPDAFEPKYLDKLVIGSRGGCTLICPDIHLSYKGRHSISPGYIIEALKAKLYDKGIVITDLSAVEEEGPCRVTGEPGPMTHIAVKLVRPDGAKFRIYGTDPYTVFGIPHIRLIRDPKEWSHIYEVFHHSLGIPIQWAGSVSPGLTPSVPAVVFGHGDPANQSTSAATDLPPKARGNVERYERAKEAFESFRATNTDFVHEIFVKPTNGKRGKGHWYSYFKEASKIADYLMMEDLAVTFNNCQDPSMIATELQKVCNGGHTPNTVILTYYDGNPSDDVVLDIHQLCEQIASGSLPTTTIRSGDVPLALWKPNVFVFANFCPVMPDPDFDNGYWTLSLPSPTNNTGLLIAPRTYIETLIGVANRSSRPQPEVLDVSDLFYALRVLLPEDLELTFRAPRQGAKALFAFFSPAVLFLFLQERYTLALTLHKRFGGSRSIPGRQVIGEAVSITNRTTPESIIGKTGRIGAVYIQSIPITCEEKILFMGDISGSVHPVPSPNVLGNTTRSRNLSDAPAPSLISDRLMELKPKSMGEAEIRWGIYCRAIDTGDLIKQREYAIAHAESAGLVPIAGPRVYFNDWCGPEAHPNSRQGLQAFLESGATGMLCARSSMLATNEDFRAALAFLQARGVVFRAVDA